MFVLVADEIGINELRNFLVTCKRECASVYTLYVSSTQLDVSQEKA